MSKDGNHETLCQACSRHINCYTSFVLQTDLFRAYAHSHAATLPHRNSMLHSIHEHEQERDDMIYPAPCSHQGKLRRSQPPALSHQRPKEVIRMFPRICSSAAGHRHPTTAWSSIFKSQSADLFAELDKKLWEPCKSEAGRRDTFEGCWTLTLLTEAWYRRAGVWYMPPLLMARAH